MFDPLINLYIWLYYFLLRHRKSHCFCFFTFKDNLFRFSDWDTLFSSILNCVASALIFRVLHSVVSSAEIIELKWLLDCAISLMYIIKSRGPSMEPCVTPVSIRLYWVWPTSSTASCTTLIVCECECECECVCVCVCACEPSQMGRSY